MNKQTGKQATSNQKKEQAQRTITKEHTSSNQAQ